MGVYTAVSIILLAAACWARQPLKIHPADDAVEVGQSGVIGCSVETPTNSTDDFSFSWVKASDPDVHLSRVTPASKNPNKPAGPGVKKAVIRFKNATIGDGACYSCLLSNGQRVVSRSTACLLVYRLPRVHFGETPDNLSCSVTSFPPGDVLIANVQSPHVETSAKNGDGTVTVTSTIFKEDAGEGLPERIICAVTYYQSTREYAFMRRAPMVKYVAIFTVLGIVLLAALAVGLACCAKKFCT